MEVDDEALEVDEDDDEALLEDELDCCACEARGAAAATAAIRAPAMARRAVLVMMVFLSDLGRSQV